MGDWRSGDLGQQAGGPDGLTVNGLLATAELVGAAEPGLLGCTADGRLTFVDARAAALLGRPAAALVGSSAIGNLLDADSSLVLRDALESGRSARSWTIVDAAGERREVLLTVTAPDGDSTASGTNFVLALTDLETTRTAAEALRFDAARYRGVLEHGSDGMWSFDREGRTVELSDRMCTMLGRTPEEVLGRRAREFLTGAANDLFEAIERGDGGDGRVVDLALLRPDGRELPVRLVTLMTTGPLLERTGTTVLVTDQTQWKRAEQAIRAQERFRGAFQDAPIAMAVVDVDERFLEVNDALCRLTGLSEEELEGRSIDELTVDDEPSADPTLLPVHAGTGAGERKLRHADGDTVWVSVHVRLWSAEGQPTRLLLQLTDISERKHYEAQLRHLGEHDPLTGLANRRQLSRELERHVARVQRHGPTGAILLLDLDQFKMINDTMGHSAGDRVIVGVASALSGRLRASDVLARLGGDEFAVLLPDVDSEQAVRIGQDLAASLAGTRIRLDQTHSHAVSTSVGVATFEGDRITPDEVLARADKAMYQAKDEGPGRVCLFSTADNSPACAVQSAERGRSAVLAAMRARSFRLMAQPMVDLRTDQVTHYELLVRLEVGDRLMLPASFLPTASRHGLVSEVDRWVFRRALEMLRGRTLGDSTLCINVDGSSLGDRDFLTEIERSLTKEIGPRLVIEVTETSGLPNLQGAHEFMSRIRSTGATFAIDDFGAGFGSLHHLRQLPFDYLKIDGEFVRRAGASSEDQVVIGALVTMARGLGMRTVAECVEEPGTLRLLHVLGVDLAQGWHIGYPGEVDLSRPGGSVVELESLRR